MKMYARHESAGFERICRVGTFNGFAERQLASLFDQNLSFRIAPQCRPSTEFQSGPGTRRSGLNWEWHKLLRGFPITAQRHRALLLLAYFIRNLDIVMRRLISALLALSLLWATSPVFATSIECVMPETMADMSNEAHDRMDCCTIDCVIACPAPALLPQSSMIAIDPPADTSPATFLATTPDSVSSQPVDPPPRLHFI